MSGISDFLNYLEKNFAFGVGKYWDPEGTIRAGIKTDLAMISSGNIDWPRLVSDGERLGIAIEQQDDLYRDNKDIRQVNAL